MFTDGTFAVDNHPTMLPVEEWSGCIGSWDKNIFQGNVEDLTYSIKNPLDRIEAGFIKRDPLAWFCSHRHQRDGSEQAYCIAICSNTGLHCQSAQEH